MGCQGVWPEEFKKTFLEVHGHDYDYDNPDDVRLMRERSQRFSDWVDKNCHYNDSHTFDDPQPEVERSVTGRVCAICGASLAGKRPQAKTCGEAHRKELSRRKAAV